eukprot:scaffold2275_cov245-Pinguiococcus_pyrenoidosus.AAC.3
MTLWHCLRSAGEWRQAGLAGWAPLRCCSIGTHAKQNISSAADATGCSEAVGVWRPWSSMESEGMFQLYPQRFAVLALFCLLNWHNNVQWIQLSAVAPLSRQHFDINAHQLNLLSQLYMLAYLPLGLPTARFLQRRGLRQTLLLGAFFNAIGAALRYLAAVVGSYGILVTGQGFSALAQVSEATERRAQWRPCASDPRAEILHDTAELHHQRASGAGRDVVWGARAGRSVCSGGGGVSSWSCIRHVVGGPCTNCGGHGAAASGHGADLRGHLRAHPALAAGEAPDAAVGDASAAFWRGPRLSGAEKEQELRR